MTIPLLPVTLGVVGAFSWGKLMRVRVRVWPRASQKEIIITDVFHKYFHFHVNLPLPLQSKDQWPEAPQCGGDPCTYDDDDLAHP